MVFVRTFKLLDVRFDRPGLFDHVRINSLMDSVLDVFDASCQLVQTMVDMVEGFVMVMIVVIVVMVVVMIIVMIVVMIMIMVVVVIVMVMVMVMVVVMVSFSQCNADQRHDERQHQRSRLHVRCFSRPTLSIRFSLSFYTHSSQQGTTRSKVLRYCIHA